VQQRDPQRLLLSANKSADPIDLLGEIILGPPWIHMTAHRTFSLKQIIHRFGDKRKDAKASQ
jgi:hypothetical protein